MSPEHEEAIHQCVVRIVGGSTVDSHVLGPALIVVLVELAKACDAPLDPLVEDIRSQYELATGGLFEELGVVPE